jgi:hypothetical protein
MMGGAVVLIPWIVHLGFILPANYVAHNWPATWIGFDCLLTAFMVATAVLGWLRRQLVVLPAFTTGVLLICDAWFDIMTAAPSQIWVSVLTAALGNLPLAVILITWRIADPAPDSNTALVSRPWHAGVAPAVGAVTGRYSGRDFDQRIWHWLPSATAGFVKHSAWRLAVPILVLAQPLRLPPRRFGCWIPGKVWSVGRTRAQHRRRIVP